MQNKVIAVTVYPITSKDSVGLVGEILCEDGKYSFIKTNDRAKAQRFGAEAGTVAKWLNTLTEVTHLVMVDNERAFANVCFQAIDYPTNPVTEQGAEHVPA